MIVLCEVKIANQISASSCFLCARFIWYATVNNQTTVHRLLLLMLDAITGCPRLSNVLGLTYVTVPCTETIITRCIIRSARWRKLRSSANSDNGTLCVQIAWNGSDQVTPSASVYLFVLLLLLLSFYLFIYFLFLFSIVIIYTHMHMHARARAHTHTHTHIYIYIYIYIYIFMCVCIDYLNFIYTIYIYIFISK